MSLAIDSSTPARFTGSTDVNGNFTTGTFNTPANCLVVVTVGMSGPPFTNLSLGLSNNGAATTWATIGEASVNATGHDGVAGAYWTYLSVARTGLTITVNGDGASQYTAVKVYNVTGAPSSGPIGGSVISGTTGGSVTTNGFTIAANGSFGFVSCLDDIDSGTVTSSDTAFDAFENFGDVSGGAGYKSLGASGTTATFNITGGSTAAWNYVTFEVKASTVTGGGGGTPPGQAIPTFVNGTIVRAADLNSLGANVTNLYNYTMSGFRTYKPITVVRILRTFSATNASPSVIQFDTVDAQTDGMYDSFLTNQSLLYLSVRTTGIYRLYLQFTMAPGTSNSFLELHLCINGTSISTNAVSGTLMSGRAVNTHATVALSVGNTIYGVVTQNTGSSQNASSTYGGSYLIAEWISP